MGLRTHFTTMKDAKSNATAKLGKISKEAFCWCFQQWQDSWNKCACVYVYMYACVSKGHTLWRWLVKLNALNITMQYHHSGNFLTAHRIRFYISIIKTNFFFM
jgi:hypothetical protein